MKDLVTCGQCGRTWDDSIPTSWTPAPSARCPFEYFHDVDDVPADFPVQPVTDLERIRQSVYTLTVTYIVTVEADSGNEALDAVSRLVDNGSILDVIEGNDPLVELERDALVSNDDDAASHP